MEEPITCTGELEELALALELEVEPLAALQLEQALRMIRDFFTAGDFGASSRVEAVRRVANQCWGFVTAARGQGGYLWGGDIGNAVLTPGFKVETEISSVDAWRDSEARRAAKGGYAGKRRLAAKGRRVHRRQGDKLAGKAAVKRLAHVAGGGGRRGPSAGACRPAERNLLRPGARAGRAGVPTAWGPMPASPDGATFRALHLTRSGRLWMARKRLLLLRSGGQVGRRGRRS
tara:strand:- start:1 stop:696 length:696 start_codon:yes stop_codon:yes gene_type:complete